MTSTRGQGQRLGQGLGQGTARAGWIVAAGLVAVACAGCASHSVDERQAAAARPRGHAVVRIAAQKGNAAEFPVTDADVARFGERVAAHVSLQRRACARELVRDAPDLALECFRRLVGRLDSESETLRQSLAVAWEHAFGEPALRAGDDARRADRAEASRAVDILVEGLSTGSAERLREAGAAFAALGDPFWAEECDRLVAARTPVGSASAPLSAAPTAAQADARALEAARALALARRWGPARDALQPLMDAVLRHRDLSVAAELEDLRSQPELAAAFRVEESRRWLIGLGGLALDRGLHLLALRCAMTARDAAPAGIDPEGRDAARRLFARASAARGDFPLARRSAEGLLDEARSASRRAEEAQAAALIAEILLAEDRAKEAAGLYLHAAGVADSLHAGMLKPCFAELERLRGAAAGTTGSTGRRARFARVLLAAASREDDDALELLVPLISDAEAAGDYALVEKCDGVKSRID
jgi:hypothetical protein